MTVELVGNMHCHTPYSDGTAYHQDIARAAIRAGLDFVIVTDHNVLVRGVEGYVADGDRRVLLLTGEEVHDMRREPQANHMLIYGVDRELCPHGHDPQRLIDETRAAGGLCFLAHPNDSGIGLIDQPPLGWYDWDIEGFTGLEIWNYMTSFAAAVDRAVGSDAKGTVWNKLRALRMIRRPTQHVVGPEPATLARWDKLLAAGQRIVGIGNSDAHGTVMGLGPIQETVFPYEFLFRAVNTHVVVEEPLRHELVPDRAAILAALRRGNCWVGYDLLHPTAGFRFTGQSRDKGMMGDVVRLDAGATLQVKAPTRCNIRLIRHGEVVAAGENDTNLTHIPYEAGAYRVECTLLHDGAERGWIYSNPIYLT